MILKGAGDRSFPKNFLTRSLCTFPGVSHKSPAVPRNVYLYCHNQASQLTARCAISWISQALSFPVANFRKRSNPKGLGSADILAHLRGQSCNGIRLHLGFPAHQTVLVPDALWIYWLSSPQWPIVQTQSNWAIQPTKAHTKNKATQPRTCLTQSMLAALTFLPPCFSLCLLCHQFFLNLQVSSPSASWPWLPFASLTSNLSRQCMPG